MVLVGCAEEPGSKSLVRELLVVFQGLSCAMGVPLGQSSCPKTSFKSASEIFPVLELEDELSQMFFVHDATIT